MKNKLILLFAIPTIIFILSDNNWPSNIQIDSTIKTLDIPIQIINLDSIINHGYLFFPEISKLSFYNFSDSLISLIDIDNFGHQLNNDYLFHSNFSENWRINDQLLNYIDYRKELALKSDLGVFGKVLGNARTITTLILAVLHILKYRKGLY
jgi:hypothetical protein